MAFEKRGNNRYYYKKERNGKSVVSRYIGSGMNARLIAELDELEADSKEAKRFEKQQRRETVERFDAELNQLEKTLQNLTFGYLIANGYHQTDSREWRRKRNGN